MTLEQMERELKARGFVPKARCDFTHAQDMEYIRAKDIEVERMRGLLAEVDAHYSGSLDHQPGYVKRIRAFLAELSA